MFNLLAKTVDLRRGTLNQDPPIAPTRERQSCVAVDSGIRKRSRVETESL